MTCEIICVGTELLLGDILNTDAQYLSQELAAMGIGVLRQSVVGDNEQRLSETLQLALSRSDIVITTGGLGPTDDDLTKEVCCAAMGTQMVEDAEILEGIRAFFRQRGREMSENNRKQALVPLGGVILHNSNGTAPGCAIEKNGKTLIMLPGPPRELKPMFDDCVKPLLMKYSDGVIFSRQVRMFGIGESAMAEKVEDLLASENPTVAPYAKDGECLLRVTAKAANTEKAKALCDTAIAKIKERLSEYIYGIDVDSLQERAVQLLKEKKLTVAFAESCTAGYAAKRLTEIDGSSEVFSCGIVSYSAETKMKLLGVKKETIDEFSVYSEQTAAEMAEGVRRLSGADIAVSVTGIAGPGGGTNEKPVGYACIALAHSGGTIIRELRTGRNKNSREYNRYVASSTMLHTLIEFLSKDSEE